jgi:hypothetical protein
MPLITYLEGLSVHLSIGQGSNWEFEHWHQFKILCYMSTVMGKYAQLSHTIAKIWMVLPYFIDQLLFTSMCKKIVWKTSQLVLCDEFYLHCLPVVRSSWSYKFCVVVIKRWVCVTSWWLTCYCSWSLWCDTDSSVDDNHQYLKDHMGILQQIDHICKTACGECFSCDYNLK